MKRLGISLTLAAVALIALGNSAFVVRQTEQALVLEFGKPVREIQSPGLKFKVPFLQNVEMYDKRLIDFDAEPKEIIAADQKYLVVDAFVRYRITDPLRFKQAVGNEATMRSRLNTILDASLRQALGDVVLTDIISAERAELMHEVRQLVNDQAKGAGKDKKGGFGIDVVDVRIVRADLPLENSEGIYRRMQTERQREAAEFRAKGAEDAQKIRSQADKERTILLAEAKKKAEILRGEGDKEATRIFAESFGQDQEFFQFYRTMQAYKKTLSQKDTTVVLSPDNEFLKFLDKAAPSAGH